MFPRCTCQRGFLLYIIITMANTANDKIQDRYISHQTYVLRFGAHQGNQAKETISATESELARLIREYIEILKKPQNQTSIRKLNQLRRDVDEVRSPGFKEAEAFYTSEMVAFAASEMLFVEKAFTDALPDIPGFKLKIPLNTVDDLVTKNTYNGLTLNQWWTRLEQSDIDRVVQSTVFGVTQGLNSTDIANNIRGNLKTTDNGIDMITRTVTNGIGNAARDEVYKANAEIIDWVVWHAVLDGRTSEICIHLDEVGKWRPDEPHPTPPAHPNCRSVLVPSVDPQGLIGERATVGGTNFRRAAREKAGDRWKTMTEKQKLNAITRARNNYGKEVIGFVPAETTYEQWLRKQPASFQDEVLGKTKGRLFRNEGLSVDKFVDEKTLKPLTLAEIAKREGIKIDRTRVVRSRKDVAFDKATRPKKSPIKPKSERIVEVPSVRQDVKSAPRPAKLTRQELGQLEYYKGDGFYENNKVLLNPSRYDKNKIELAQKSTDRLDRIIDKNKTSKDHVFYRGIRSNEMFENAESLVGKSLQNVTTQSTTFDRGVAKRYAGLVGEFSSENNSSVLFKINVKKGTSAMNVSNYTNINSEEREILLKSNSKYKVKGVQDKGQYKIIEVDYEE